MKKQFIVLVVTAVLLVLGWTIIEYLLQSQIQFQLRQLSTYPVMVYTWDVDLVNQLKADLLKQTYIKSTEFMTSEQAATDLIKKYNLAGAEEILETKTLPNVLIIYLKGDMAARKNKLLLKSVLESPTYQNRIMTELQTDIWTKTWQRIDQFRQGRWIVLGFLALVISLVFFFKRLHYEHRLARIRHLVHLSPVDEIMSHDRYWINSALLVLMPVALGAILYEIFYYTDWLLYSIDWYFFVIQAGVLSAATLAAYPFEQKYRDEEPGHKDAAE